MYRMCVTDSVEKKGGRQNQAWGRKWQPKTWVHQIGQLENRYMCQKGLSMLQHLETPQRKQRPLGNFTIPTKYKTITQITELPQRESVLSQLATVETNLNVVFLLLGGGAPSVAHTKVRGLTVLQLSQEPDRKSRKKLCTYIWHTSTLVRLAHGLQRLAWPTPFPLLPLLLICADCRASLCDSYRSLKSRQTFKLNNLVQHIDMILTRKTFQGMSWVEFLWRSNQTSVEEIFKKFKILNIKIKLYNGKH